MHVIHRSRKLKMWLNFLVEHAPEMKIKPAMEIVGKIISAEEEMHTNAEALAILSHVQINASGAEEFPEEEKNNAVAKATERASHCYGWVTCGPGQTAMRELIEEWGKK